MELTLAIVKPDRVKASNTGSWPTSRAAASPCAARACCTSPRRRRAFYEVHKERPFYGELVEFMTSGPVVPVALERDHAVAYLRETMGATDSRKAAPGTIRQLYGTDVQYNAIHGSDSAENAAKELAFFFPGTELIASR